MDPQPSCSHHHPSICEDEPTLKVRRMPLRTPTVQRLPPSGLRSSSCTKSQSSAVRPIPARRHDEHSGLPTALHILLLTVIGLSLAVPADATSKNESSATNSVGCAHMPSLINGLSRSRSLPKIDERTVPSRPIAGDHLKVCTQSLTCCTEEMEIRLTNESGEDFQRRIQDKIIGLRHTFESRSSRFDRFFRELLTSARKELHTMFVQTYGGFYERHADVFSGLFDNLTDYYTTGRSDVSESLDGFYQTLYRRMFTIMNPLMPVTDEKWECMKPTMDELHPFGDVPRKMTQQVQRSMVAARVFVEALATARDVVHRVMELNLSSACSTGLMRMSYCSACGGVPDVRPCNNLCLNVMKGCLARQTELDADWNAFIGMYVFR
uniref:Glypican-6 n=1 Tax=Plectus sambesii TaxID=2011161 RepID=A0A914XGA7_9BILA